MRLRLLFAALFASLLLTLLFLFPPFLDGRHHFLTWQPTPAQTVDMAWNFTLRYADVPSSLWTTPNFLHPAWSVLALESIAALLAAFLLFLALELIAEVREREEVYKFAPRRLSLLRHFVEY